MHPILSPEVIQALEMTRRQYLAAAERDRLIKGTTTASGNKSSAAVSLVYVRDGLATAVGALARFRGARGVPTHDEAAAIRSA